METQCFSKFSRIFFLEDRVANQFEESASAFNIYKHIFHLNLLIEIIVQQCNLYLQQILRKFLTNAWEMKILVGVNYIMTVNRLPSIPVFWDCNHYVCNVGIQNIFARSKNQVVVQNNHFVDSTKQSKIDKDHKIWIINYLNESFQGVCIDEYMTKFKEISCFLS